MSAIAQPIAGPQVRKKQATSWEHLKSLVPYVFRYKGMVGLGLLSLTLMGLAGALPQLIIGTIMDCLKGSDQPLSTLTGVSRSVLSPLFSFYAPLSRHALAMYCIILVVVMLIKG